MKVEGYLFAFIAFFLAPTDVVYWYYSHDPTGTTALALGAGLGALIGVYLLFTASRIEPRPEDLEDADISDGAGELGFFSPYSWAPLWCGLAAATTFLGLVFGWWLFFIGAAFAIPAVGSMLFEYYSDEPLH
ncbi:MAG: cytochrome c oxidase subunit 4 [Frankiaceae bacterium]|nr:cytochrome c oxidase subunit 4 [Frankiaceae bacterium]MBV9369680.1 cytochrome c oxidase subunit 4 [Frankiales bacterium]